MRGASEVASGLSGNAARTRAVVPFSSSGVRSMTSSPGVSERPRHHLARLAGAAGRVDQFLGAEHAEKHQPRFGDVAAEVPGERHGPLVGPMQVVHHQHQRHHFGNPFEQRFEEEPEFFAGLRLAAGRRVVEQHAQRRQQAADRLEIAGQVGQVAIAAIHHAAANPSSASTRAPKLRLPCW
jgi:hypothetical protein